MRLRSSLVVALLPLTVLVACNGTPGTTDNGSSASSEQTDEPRETRNVSYRGTLREAGMSIYMQGTHELDLIDGRTILLESEELDLDKYVDKEVEVFGAVRPTSEEGGRIMRVQRVTVFSAESSVSSDTASSVSSDNSSDMSSAASSISSMAASSVSSMAAAQSSKAQSSKQAVASSIAPASSLAASSVATTTGGDAAMQARVNIMVKDNLADANWTQRYCSPHIGFCLPVHRNWWFKSFGTTTSALWHVEIAPSEIDAIGQGPITIRVVSGSIASKGVSNGEVRTEGNDAVGYHSWTEDRHIEVRGPSALKAAINYLTSHIVESEA